MGLVFYFLGFFLKCFHVLAWPSVALGYPLYASIRAVETNSKYHMRKLITYWIIFTLISLLELGLAHLIEWVPFWPHIKLIAIFLLVIPGFNGAFYVYQSVIHPCLYMDLQVAIRQLNKPIVRIYFNKDALLIETESYAEDNGPQDVTKLDCKEVEHAEVDLAQAQVKTCALAGVKEPETTAVAECTLTEIPASIKVQKEWSCAICQETNTSEKLLNDHLEEEKHKAKFKELKSFKKTVKNMKFSPSTVNESQQASQSENEVKHVEGDLAQTEVETFASIVKGTEILPTNAERKASEVPDSAKVQKEWTCVVCQITAANEKTLNEHLQGKKHRNKCDEQKANNPKAKNTDSSSVADISQTNQGLDNEVKHAKGELGAKIGAATELNLPATMMVHGEGSLSWVPGSTNVQKEWNCTICQVTTPNQKSLDSHLGGKKHRSKCKQIEASKQTAKTMESSSSTASKSHNAKEDSPDKVFKDGSNQSSTNRSTEEKVQVNVSSNDKTKGKKVDTFSDVVKQSVVWCSICNVRCPGEIDMHAHIRGRKHLSNLQQMNSLQRQLPVPVNFYGSSSDVYLSNLQQNNTLLPPQAVDFGCSSTDILDQFSPNLTHYFNFGYRDPTFDSSFQL